MSAVDTSTEAVERLAQRLENPPTTRVTPPLSDVTNAAATLRALAAERDAQAEGYERCLRKLSAAYEAEADRDRLAAERDALAADCIIRVAEENQARHVAETERDRLAAEVARLREALSKIERADFDCMPRQWSMAMRAIAQRALAGGAV